MTYMTLSERLNIPRYDDPNKIKWGTSLIDQDTCNGCSLCVKTCPADALMLKDKKAVFKDGSACSACAACAAICPENAASVIENFEFDGMFKLIGFGELSRPRL